MTKNVQDVRLQGARRSGVKMIFRPLPYQLEAVDAVVEVFSGQEKHDFQITGSQLGYLSKSSEQRLIFNEEAPFANNELFDREEILKNIRKIQAKNGLPISETLISRDSKRKQGRNKQTENKQIEDGQSENSTLNINIEMETGTGKTYTYLRTIYELNKKYGWTKFIIVVPSIAIREGVRKSIEMMQDDLLAEYGKKPRAFIYNSKSLQYLENFASDSGINIMIINMQAFNARGSDKRRIYEKMDDFSSRSPIEIIAKSRPILILDEPQKMEGGKTVEGINDFNPLFILRYSATHSTHHNLIYRLDALDAYQKRLVKKITVKSIEVVDLTGNNSHIYLEEIILSKGEPVARLEIEVKLKDGSFKRQIIKVKKGANLYELSKGAEQYKDGYVVADINYQGIELVNGISLHVGQGQLNDEGVRRLQIRETIRAHLEKESHLFHRGIKVLSLFFIDEVAKYRQYNDSNIAYNGDYAEIFEEEYKLLVEEYLQSEQKDTEYSKYLASLLVSETHNGYFSVDKNLRMVNPEVRSDRRSSKKEENIFSEDVNAYDLILKDKESLLDFPTPEDDELSRKKKSVRFIFSHSALREGWDNPNVFVICTLKQSNNNVSRRQEVGRGLRLCVSKDGTRMDSSYLPLGEVHTLNNLTVVTNESYASFVDNLQSALREEVGNRPTKIDQQYFIGKTIIDNSGAFKKIGRDDATELCAYFIENNYSDARGNLKEAYSQDKEQGILKPLPEYLQDYENAIHHLVSGVAQSGWLERSITNGNSPHNTINQSNKSKKEFKELWRRINKRVIYQVKLDTERLVEESISAIQRVSSERSHCFIPRPSYVIRTAQQVDQMNYRDIEDGSIFGKTQAHREMIETNEYSHVTYDLIGAVAQQTNLTRQTIARILSGIDEGIFKQFAVNPEKFIYQVSQIINEEQARLVMYNVAYEFTGGEYSEREIFISNIPLSEGAIKADKHIWEYVETDSQIERNFVTALEEAVDDVVVYAKLPRSFEIPTPFGGYNPDWAIAFNQKVGHGMVRNVYFVAETKGSTQASDLREAEQRKLESARAFFALLANCNGEKEENGTLSVPVKYGVVKSFDELMQLVAS